MLIECESGVNIQSEVFVYVGKFLLEKGFPCHKNSTETSHSVLILSRVYCSVLTGDFL